MKIAVDAMGGDHAPLEIVKGVELALKAFPDLEVTLFGNENLIKETLTMTERVSIIHTEEKIYSDEDPVMAVRRKKNASLVLAATAVKNGEADAIVSAGSTGAVLTAGLFVIGRIEGIERPALAPTFPTVDGKGFVLLDVGANAECKPKYLQQFAIMGSIYAEKVRGIKKPRVGLINIGTEENKGNDLAKETFALLKETNLNFVGNIEAREILNGPADVLVTDGWTGNMVLKTTEGVAMSLFKMMKEAMTSDLKSKLAAAVLKPNLKKLKNKMDYSEYGGACLFGIKSPVIKAHGSSDATAFYNAIRQARIMVEANLAEEIAKAISV
ncbi:MAG: plsX [Bacillales bacterium]|jgi:glycerol-3-phosphate acyltransferase PlsX|nr:plsX [Bacillales bacterium]